MSKKKNTRKRKTIKTKKTKNISMIQSSNKNILKKAEIKEQIDPIIIKYSSSDKNTLKKTKYLKYHMRYNSFKIKPKENNNSIIIKRSEIEDNKGWIMLCYICAPYVLLMKKDSQYISYHTKRGMFLFYFEILLLILYYFTKNTIKTKTSCDNFPYYTLGTTCTATPWWVTFIWAVLTLILVFVIVGLIKKALEDNKVPNNITNYN